MRPKEGNQIITVPPFLPGNLNLAAKVTPRHASAGAVAEVEPHATRPCNIVRHEPKLDPLTVGKCGSPGLKTKESTHIARMIAKVRSFLIPILSAQHLVRFLCLRAYVGFDQQ